MSPANHPPSGTESGANRSFDQCVSAKVWKNEIRTFAETHRVSVVGLTPRDRCLNAFAHPVRKLTWGVQLADGFSQREFASDRFGFLHGSWEEGDGHLRVRSPVGVDELQASAEAILQAGQCPPAHHIQAPFSQEQILAFFHLLDVARKQLLSSLQSPGGPGTLKLAVAPDNFRPGAGESGWLFSCLRRCLPLNNRKAAGEARTTLRELEEMEWLECREGGIVMAPSMREIATDLLSPQAGLSLSSLDGTDAERLTGYLLLLRGRALWKLEKTATGEYLLAGQPGRGLGKLLEKNLPTADEAGWHSALRQEQAAHLAPPPPVPEKEEAPLPVQPEPVPSAPEPAAEASPAETPPPIEEQPPKDVENAPVIPLTPEEDTSDSESPRKRILYSVAAVTGILLLIGAVYGLVSLFQSESPWNEMLATAEPKSALSETESESRQRPPLPGPIAWNAKDAPENIALSNADLESGEGAPPEKDAASRIAKPKPKPKPKPRTDLRMIGDSRWQSDAEKQTVLLKLDELSNQGTKRSGKLRLELWATREPYKKGIRGHRLGVWNLQPLGPGESYKNLAKRVPYSAPPDGEYYTFMQVSEETPKGSFQRDRIQYKEKLTFYQKPLRFIGGFGFETNPRGKGIKMEIDEIAHQRPSGESGTIKIQLFLTKKPYSENPSQQGYIVMDFNMGKLKAGYSFKKFSKWLHYNQPPPGNYYANLFVQEYTEDGFILHDVLTHNKPLRF